MRKIGLLVVSLVILSSCGEEDPIIANSMDTQALESLELSAEAQDLLAEGPKVVAPPKTDSGFYESTKNIGEKFLSSVNPTINFDYNSYSINEFNNQTLLAQANFLKDAISKNQAVKVVIEGHTDERGTREYNLALGERRAAAVARFLERAGVPSGNIQVISYGKERPLAQEHTPTAWGINRRATTIIVTE